jgi:hypothetical protein
MLGSVTYGSNTINIAKLYDVKVSLTDAYSTVTVSNIVPTVSRVFDFRSDRAALGGIAAIVNSFQVPLGWKMYADGDKEVLHTGNWSTYAAAKSHSHPQNQVSVTVSGYGESTQAISAYPSGLSVQYNGGTGTPSIYGQVITFNGGASRNFQLWNTKDSENLYIRNYRSVDAVWSTWRLFLHSGNYNDYAPTKTGTGASGSWDISITGNAATATKAATLTTARTLTIGSKGKTFNGSANVSWTLAEIGALPLTGGTITGDLNLTNKDIWINTTNDDRFLYFKYTTGPGFSWRLGYLGTGSGNANYFTLETDDTNGVWEKVFTVGLTTKIMDFVATPTVSGSSILTAANYNDYAPTKTGTGASGTWGISITGNAASATKLTTARTLTIGSTGKTFNGTGNVSWTLAEIGAAAEGHSHSYLPLSGGTLTGSVKYTSSFQYNAASGGWARGLDYNTNDGSSDIGFVGALGTSDTLTYLAMGTTYNDPKGFRWYPDGTATLNGSQVLHASNYNSYAPSKTGTGASGTWGISITGNAATASTATKLTTARTLTIGSTGKTFNGTGNVSWTLAEIGAAAASHTHSYLKTGGSISSTGEVTLSSSAIALGNNGAGSTGFPSQYGFYALFSGSNYARSFVLWKNNSATSSLQYSGINSDLVTLNGWKTILDSSNCDSYAQRPVLSGTADPTTQGVNGDIYIKYIA